MNNRVKNNLYKLKQHFQHNGLFFCYSGPLSQGIIEEVGTSIQSQIWMDSQNKTVALKIFAIFVEQTQNIIKYSADILQPGSKDCIIILGKNENQYTIGFGSLMQNGNKLALLKRLDQIHKMDKCALHKYYKEQLRAVSSQDDSSVGIGLIEIAKNANEPIEYDILPINQEYSFFSLKAVVYNRN